MISVRVIVLNPLTSPNYVRWLSTKYKYTGVHIELD
jgi:hypothetical protein